MYTTELKEQGGKVAPVSIVSEDPELVAAFEASLVTLSMAASALFACTTVALGRVVVIEHSCHHFIKRKRKQKKNPHMEGHSATSVLGL